MMRWTAWAMGKALVLVVAAVLVVLAGAVRAEGYGVLQEQQEQGQQDIVLLPNTTTGSPAAALIFIQGAEIPTQAYLPLVDDIVAAFSQPLWVGIPAFPFMVAEPLVLKSGIDRVLGKLAAAGMPNGTALFFAGHSLGGATIQDYVVSLSPAPVGQILMGAFLTHKYDSLQYPVPTLTMGGSLDGLCRCTRVAENWFRYIGNRSMSFASTFPVVIVPGMSHMQFASGKPPALVFDRDLKPAITYDEAHARVARTVAAFMELRLQVQPSQALALLRTNVSTTGTFSQPIVTALHMEGYWLFKPPCYKLHSSQPCIRGSPWLTNMSVQAALVSLPADSVVNTDTFDDVSDPTPTPAISNKCPGTNTAACTLHTSTVTELRYNVLTVFDTGFTPISAYEMETKLNSKQTMLAAVGTSRPFNQTDGPDSNLCRIANAMAWEYGWTTASTEAQSRFKALGQPMVMADDKPVATLASWPDEALVMTTVPPSAAAPMGPWANSRATMQVQAPYIAFPSSMPASSGGGGHFCKLLSPARAMEWIYVDGLRYYASLATNHTAP